jgi:predicted GNAT family acetyltransferase
VHEIKEGGETDIASIVAATRQSDTVAAITKVYTPEKWSRKGRAERLVRRVCREYELSTMRSYYDADFCSTRLLKTHEQVVLYVGSDKNSAQKLYNRVGFQDLCKKTPERWLEIGFDKAEVELGHW